MQPFKKFSELIKENKEYQQAQDFKNKKQATLNLVDQALTEMNVASLTNLTSTQQEQLISKLFVNEKANKEDDVEEGNAFIYAAAKAKKDGKDSFEFNGKTYKVKLKTDTGLKEHQMIVTEACWDGYEQQGMKTKDGKQVPNCVPVGEKEVNEAKEKFVVYDVNTKKRLPNAAKTFATHKGAKAFADKQDNAKVASATFYADKIQEGENKEINSIKEFKEYAMSVLKKAFGDEFDEAKAQQVIDGLIEKHGEDYGAMVGALKASLNEKDVNEGYEDLKNSKIFNTRTKLSNAEYEKFKDNYIKLHSENTIEVDVDNKIHYGFRKGATEAHWKYFEDRDRVFHSETEQNVLGLINFFEEVKDGHPWAQH